MIVIDRKQPLNINPLNHPLDPYAPLIERLVHFLDDRPPDRPFPLDSVHQILEAVRRALEVDFVAFFRQEGHQNGDRNGDRNGAGTYHPWRLQAKVGKEGESSRATADWVGRILAQAEQEAQQSLQHLLSPEHHGLFHAYEADGLGQFAALVPLPARQGNDLIVVAGLPQESRGLGDVCGRMLMSLYGATCGFTTVSSAAVEAMILDDLRRTYGLIPKSLYQRRFQLFCDRLCQMQIYFEPVLRLDPDYPYIDSWEALARDPIQDCAPVDLFGAAELWGDRFMVHLDAQLMLQAVSRYREACQFSSGRRQEDMRELSVNVYPPSLMQDYYYEAMQQVVKEKLLQPEKLILEISEKLPLPVHPEDASIDFFKKQLGRYVRDLKVGFSIDDFGAGHASVSRLTGLNPSHVKIDRELLYQERQPTEITLRFVLDLASSTRLRAPKVVVEGFDNSSPMTLGQLYRLGIRYVQGHVIGKASPELSRLGKDRTRFLQRLIQDER